MVVASGVVIGSTESGSVHVTDRVGERGGEGGHDVDDMASG